MAAYSWNEQNRMTMAVQGDVQVRYRYDHEGMRTAKQSSRFGETLYPDRLYQEHFTSAPPTVATKHIFVGQTRIASKVHHREQNASNRKAFMHHNTFTYHGDHLGSTNWVTDAEGEGYEHFQYTPYGESWVEEHLSSKTTEMSHRFTGQELDEETGMYSFPARYYEPVTSRWMSVDPALGEYLPVAPVNREAREHDENLPGMGGVFNYPNLQPYHYGANNPLKYVDPAGSEVTVEFSVNNSAGEYPRAIVDGEEYAIGSGMDIDFGDVVADDAVFVVPDGAGLEIERNGESFRISGAAFHGPSLDTARREVSESEELIRAKRENRLMGAGQLAIGLGAWSATFVAASGHSAAEASSPVPLSAVAGIGMAKRG